MNEGELGITWEEMEEVIGLLISHVKQTNDDLIGDVEEYLEIERG